MLALELILTQKYFMIGKEPSIKYDRIWGEEGGLWASAYANLLINGWCHKSCEPWGGEERGGERLVKYLKKLRTYFFDDP